MLIDYTTFLHLPLILSVNISTHMYLSDLRVYFKVGWRSRKMAEKLVDYANTTDVEFIVDAKVLFRG